MTRPLPSQHPVYYKHYIDLVKNDDVIKELENQLLVVSQFISSIPKEKENFVYAPGKWTIKEVIGHLLDTERIMAYRALRFARRDKKTLQGYDENHYVLNANFNSCTLEDLKNEFEMVRKSNLILFKQFNEETLNEMGNANGTDVSVKSILFMMAGHITHHLNVIKTKYL